MGGLFFVTAWLWVKRGCCFARDLLFLTARPWAVCSSSSARGIFFNCTSVVDRVFDKYRQLQLQASEPAMRAGLVCQYLSNTLSTTWSRVTQKIIYVTRFGEMHLARHMNKGHQVGDRRLLTFRMRSLRCM